MNAALPKWQWSGRASQVPSASSTGSQDRPSKERNTKTRGPYTASTWNHYRETEEPSQATATPPGAFVVDEEEQEEENQARRDENTRPKKERHYRPRKCRICLEVVHPTFHPPTDGIAGILNPAPVVEYISEDPASGRFIRPCNCKGSMRWIHEGCLTEWRRADPGSPNFWQCTTCHFRYRLQRMDWSRAISSKAMQITLTALILFVTIFFLGFVADPIINLYLDPFDVITSGGLNEPILEDAGTWWEHLFKGLASLGVLGMIKAFVAMGPWQWLNIRHAGLFGNRRGRAATGRDRIESISWWVIAFGVITFLWGVYKLVSAWSRRLLDIAGERVADVQGNEDDDDDGEEGDD